MRSRVPARGAGARSLAAPLAAVLVAVALAVGACSGDDGPPSPATGATSPDGAAATGGTVESPPETAFPVPLFADPAEPVCIAVSRRAGIVLPADPSAGQRWRVSAAPDPSIAIPVGTEFVTTGGDGPPDAEMLSYAGRALGGTAVEVVLLGADGVPVGGGVPLRFAVEVTPDGACPPPPPPPPGETTTSLPGDGG
jgi:hypothetical protein